MIYCEKCGENVVGRVECPKCGPVNGISYMTPPPSDGCPYGCSSTTVQFVCGHGYTLGPDVMDKPTNRNIESGDVTEAFNNWYEYEVDASTTLHDAFLAGHAHAMGKVQGLVEALKNMILESDNQLSMYVKAYKREPYDTGLFLQMHNRMNRARAALREFKGDK